MRLPSSRGYDIIVEEEEEEEEGVRAGRNVAESYMFSNDSNDGASKNEERIEIRDGYPVKYKCMNTLQEDVDVHLLPITFDYEMTLEKNGKIQDNIQALEWSVLWNVVKEIGLHRCDFSQQTVAMTRISETGDRRVRRRRRRRRTQDVLTPDEDADVEERRSYVLSLTSDAEDEIDIDTVHCQSSPATANEEICVPMKGGMSVVYTGNEPALMQRFLLEEIESVMSSGVVLVEDVKFVEYVGDRQAVIEPRGSSSSTTSTGSMFAFIGIAVGVAVVAFVVVSLFVGLGVRRKRRRIGKLTVGVQQRDLQIADTTSSESDGYRSPEAMAAAVAAANASCQSSTTTVSSSSSQQQPTVSTSPKQVEHDGIMFEKPIAPGSVAAASNSVYLASTRQRKRKKGAGKKKRKSLRERVSMTPGVEPIPEGEFESFERDEWSEESDDDDDDDSPTNQIPIPPTFSSPRGQGASELDKVLTRAPSPPTPPGACPRTPSSHKPHPKFPSFRGNSELDRVLTQAVDGQWTSFESPTTPSYIVTRQHPQLPDTSPQSPHIFFPEDSDSSPEAEERKMPAPWI